MNEEVAAIAANRLLAASFYLDTKEEHSRPWPFEGKDHHQGLARTHRLQDGAVYFFLTHGAHDLRRKRGRCAGASDSVSLMRNVRRV